MFIRVLVLSLLSGAMIAQAQVQLVVGDLILPVTGHSSAFCAQIPLYLKDTSMNGRAYTYLSMTVAISGNTEILNGNVATNMLVAGGFTALSGGIRNPGADLQNIGNNPTTPTCSVIRNQATEGYPTAEFATGLLPGSVWFVNNNGENQGYKTAFILDFSLNPIGLSVQNELQLIGVLEIPILANPGQKVLTISAVPNTTVADANRYEWLEDGQFFSDDLDLSEATGNLRFCPQTLASQPQDAQACPGEAVSFTVEATGSGPFSYQWLHDGAPLNGATAATLDLTDLTLADLGAYACEITSPCATVVSGEAQLTLGEMTAAISPPGGPLGLGVFHLDASSSCGAPVVAYAWYDALNSLLSSTNQLHLDPPPTETSRYRLIVTDADQRTVTQDVWVLVNPLGPDFNGDGENSFADLTEAVPEWLSSTFDPNGDGRTNMLDFLYIRVMP